MHWPNADALEVDSNACVSKHAPFVGLVQITVLNQYEPSEANVVAFEMLLASQAAHVRKRTCSSIA